MAYQDFKSYIADKYMDLLHREISDYVEAHHDGIGFHGHNLLSLCEQRIENIDVKSIRCVDQPDPFVKIDVNVTADIVMEGINDRGILLDLTLVENVIALDEISKDKLSDAMKDITELENPNSVAQMKQWLAVQGVETDSLGKKDVAKMIADDDIDEDVTEALRLRQQLAKSSVKKY